MFSGRSRVAVPVFVALIGLIAAGCGPSGSSDTSTDSLAEYCERASAYDEATSNMEGTDPPSIIESFAVAAREARRLAEAAPAEVREAHLRLAEWAGALVDAYQEEAPATLEEFEGVGREIVADLTARYGNPDADADEVRRFASDACGLPLE